MARPIVHPRTRARLNRLRDEQLLNDTCILLSRSSGSRNEYGMPTPVYTPTAARPCAYQPLTSSEVGLVQVGVVQAICYLQPETAITTADRLRLTHINGEALGVSLLFDVAGPPEPQLTTIAVRLITVTDQPQE